MKIDKNVPQLPEKLFKDHSKTTDVKVLNSQQKSDLYHFKVMELQTYEDLKESGQISKCKVRFHFFFDILRPKNRTKLQ